MNSIDFRALGVKAFPHVLAFFLMVITATVLLSPAMLEDKTLRQGDIQNNVGMSKEARDIERRDGEVPKWTDSMFGGMPTTQITGTDIGTAPKGVWKVIRAVFPIEVGTLIVAMLSAYVLGLCLGLSPWLSLLLGLGFGLSSVNVLYLVAGHATKVRAIATMPGVVAGVVLVFRNRMWAGAGVAAFFGALHLQADHLQMTYYLMFLLGAIVLAAWIRSALMGTMKSTLQGTGLLVLAGLLAAMPMTGQLTMTEQYSEYTTRGTANLSSPEKGGKNEGLDRDYMLEYSMSRGEFWSMAIPNVKGGHLKIGDTEDGLAWEKEFSAKIKRDWYEDTRDQALEVAREFKMRNKDPRSEQEIAKAIQDQNFDVKQYENQRSGIRRIPLYWGDQAFSSGPFYFGAFAFFLCLAWMIVGSSWLKWPFWVISILAILLSWKDTTWLTDFFIDHVPMFTKFRDTKMMLVLIQIIVPVGAVMALHEMSRPELGKKWKVWAGTMGVLFVLFLTLYAIPETLLDFDSTKIEETLNLESGSPLAEKLKDVRISAFQGDALRTLGLVVLAFGLGMVLLKKWFEPKWVVVTSLAIVALDMTNADGRYITKEGTPLRPQSDYVSTMDKRFPFEPSQADLRILEKEKGSIPKAEFDAEVRASEKRWKDQLGIKALNQKAKYASQFEVLNANTHFRVLDFSQNPTSDGRTPYFHKSIGGYHGAKLMRFQEFMDEELGYEIAAARQRPGKMNSEIAPGLAMLNTKYLKKGNDLYQFPDPMGPAWFVDDVIWVTSAEEEMNGIRTLNPKSSALVHREFESTLKDVSNPGRTTVKLDQYHPEGSTYSVNSDNGGLLVLSEMYYPSGWTATIDGEETPLVRANYLLMALQVPPGEHTVQLHFEPEGWETARGLSIAGSVLWVLLLGACIWQDRRTRLASN